MILGIDPLMLFRQFIITMYKKPSHMYFFFPSALVPNKAIGQHESMTRDCDNSTYGHYFKDPSSTSTIKPNTSIKIVDVPRVEALSNPCPEGFVNATKRVDSSLSISCFD